VAVLGFHGGFELAPRNLAVGDHGPDGEIDGAEGTAAREAESDTEVELLLVGVGGAGAGDVEVDGLDESSLASV
jgi:hypothetical protein